MTNPEPSSAGEVPAQGEGGSFFGRALGRLNALGPQTAAGRERAARVCVVAFFIALFLVHTSLLRPVLQNGDSAVYNQQIESRDLSVRSPHMGYMALGILFNALLPFGTDLNMNVMVLTLGVLGLAAVYVSARTLCGSRWAALASVVLSLGLPAELRGMLLSEVDVVSASLVAIAYACFLCARPVLAGLVFGLSVLVTPLSGPLVVVFILTVSVGAGGLRGNLTRWVARLAKFGAIALLVYLPAVLRNREDYLYGGRGLFVAARAAYTWPERLARSGAFVVHQTGPALVFYLAGLAVCLASPRLWRARQPALGLLVSVGVMALAGERFSDVPVQLPNLLLTASLVPLALVASRWTKWLGPLALLAVSFFTLRTSYSLVTAEIDRDDRQRLLYAAIRDQSRPRAPVLVGLSGWGPARIFERLASSQDHRATALDWREFSRHPARWLSSDGAHEIWFLRRVSERQVNRLLSQYRLESRTAGGRRFQVLVPLTR